MISASKWRAGPSEGRDMWHAVGLSSVQQLLGYRQTDFPTALRQMHDACCWQQAAKVGIARLMTWRARVQTSECLSQHHLGSPSEVDMRRRNRNLRSILCMLVCRAGPLEGRGVWHAVSLSAAQQVLGPLRARADARLALHVPGSIPQVCPAPHASCLQH